VADFVLPKPSQAKPRQAKFGAEGAAEKKLNMWRRRRRVFFAQAKPSQAKSQCKPSLAPKAPEKKNEHMAPKAPDFFLPS
jgi:hypothetical protein